MGQHHGIAVRVPPYRPGHEAEAAVRLPPEVEGVVLVADVEVGQPCAASLGMEVWGRVTEV